MKIWNDSITGDPIVKASISHNNQTGRYTQKFKAVWGPVCEDEIIVVGNMTRMVDFYNGSGKKIAAFNQGLTSIPAVNVFHPSMTIVVSGNSSGRMTVWK